MLAGSILGAYYFMTSDEVTVPDPVQALQTVSDKSQSVDRQTNNDEPSFIMPKPDIPELFITCSVTPNRTLGNYCFEYQGKPFYPEQLGFQVQYIARYRDWETDRKSTRLNSSHSAKSRMPSSA